MPKEKTIKGEMYRNEDKIKRKTRVDNLEDFYDFRMPHKDDFVDFSLRPATSTRLMIPRATLACTRRGRGFILPYLFW